MARLTGSLLVDGNIEAGSMTGSLQGTATTASYIAAGNIDGDVTNAQNIYVNSYASYDGNQRIAFVGGVSQYHALRADTQFNFNPGQNKLSVPNVNATTLTGSLDWDQLDNVPAGIMSSSDGVVPDGTVSSSAQTIANLNSTGIISGSGQITNISITDVSTDADYPMLFSNTENPNGDFTGRVAYSQIPGGTEHIRFNPSTGRLSLGNLLGSGSIEAYGDIISNGGDLTAGRAVNTYFLSLRNNVSSFAPGLTTTGADNYWTLTATGSRDNYKIVHPSVTQGDLFWSYRQNLGNGNSQWTRVLTEQNVASGSATLTQMWVNGLVTASSGEFGTLSGTLDFDNLSNVPANIPSASNAEMHLNAMGGYQQTGSIIFGREDGVGRYHELRGYNTNTAANNYLAFRVHNGTVGETKEVMRLNGDGTTVAPFFSSSAQVTLEDTTGNISGSRVVGDIQASSVDYDNVLNKPTLVSGSAQIDFDSITNVPNELVSASGGDVTINGVLEIAEGPGFSIQQNMIIGLNAASHIRNSSISDNNTIIGVEAGYAMQTGSSDNTIIGSRALYNSADDPLAVMTSNTLIGHEVMDEGYGIGNVVVGRQSMLRASSANSNVVIGNNSLDADDYNGSSTVVIGPSAGKHLTGGSYNILIGRAAGPTTDGSLTGKLYIDTEESDTPLIYGDFVSDELTINGDLDVTGTTSGSFEGDGSGLTGVTVDSVDTASYVSSSNVDGEVYRAERARRIEVGSYGSYSNLTDIPFITGDYGSSIKRISSDGQLQWHAGTNHLTVPGVDATSITGSIISGSSITASIDAQYVDNLPFSASNEVSPIFAPRVGSTDRAHIAIGAGVFKAGITAGKISYGTVAIGDGAAGGLNAGIIGADNVVIGRDAVGNDGNLIDACMNLSVMMGYRAGFNSSGTENISIGGNSFTSGSGHSNTIMGTWAGNGYGFTGGGNTIIGTQAGGSDAAGVGITGNSCCNTILGAYATVRSGSNNVLIGHGAGSDSDFSNKLYIENGGGCRLIDGDFSSECLQINGSISASQFLGVDWDDLNNVPDGLLSSSSAPAGTVSGSTQIYSLINGDKNDIDLRGGTESQSGDIEAWCGRLNRLYIANTLTNPFEIQATSVSRVVKMLGHRLQIKSAGGNNILIGEYAGSQCDDQMSNMVLIGCNAGTWSTSRSKRSEIIGHTAGASNSTDQTHQYSTLIGHYAGSSADLDHTIAIGREAAYACNATGSVAVGAYAAANANGNYNIHLGYCSGYRGGTGGCNIYIGYNVGCNVSNTESNKLYIGCGLGNPLIHGDFGSDCVTMHGQLNVCNDVLCVNSNCDTVMSFSYNNLNTRKINMEGHRLNLRNGKCNILIGVNAGCECEDSAYYQDNVMIGHCAAPYAAQGSDNNVIIGAYAGSSFGIGQYHQYKCSIVMGRLAGYQSNLHDAIVLGREAAFTAGATGSISIGKGAGARGTYNVAIGWCAGNVGGTGGCNVYLGPQAGPSSASSESEKLYIASGSGDPLIGGDFGDETVDLNAVVKLKKMSTLPSGEVGQLAVSSSNDLYYHNGTSWSKIN